MRTHQETSEQVLLALSKSAPGVLEDCHRSHIDKEGLLLFVMPAVWHRSAVQVQALQPVPAAARVLWVVARS